MFIFEERPYQASRSDERVQILQVFYTNLAMYQFSYKTKLE